MVTVNRLNKLVVPFSAVHAEPSEDASDNAKAMHIAMSNVPTALDGKDKNSLAELGRRAKPPVAKRAASNDKNEGASLAASIDFVAAIVAQQLNEETPESDVALSSELRRKLFNLSSQIAAYFSADPMEESEEVRQAA